MAGIELSVERQGVGGASGPGVTKSSVAFHDSSVCFPLPLGSDIAKLFCS
jgi:hypothetical protein